MKGEPDHIRQCIQSIEDKLNWGSSADWTHQDFLNLSERIQEETGEPLSYITLKRVWGKVSYNSLPNANTLNTLARFLGYEGWRAYQRQLQIRKKKPGLLNIQLLPGKRGILLLQSLALLTLALIVLILIPGAKDQPELKPGDFHFSSKKVVSQGIPNSVVFDIKADKSPYDSVEVQQSWNTALRTRIPKDQSQHTSIYYYPGFFEAKLVVGGKIIQEHPLHITTDGWYCAVQQEPVPVYFPVKDIQKDGRLELSLDQMLAHNISMQPQPPLIRMGNVRDFEGLKTDHFVFEARLRNTYKEGSAVCQRTAVYLLCEGSVISVPLMNKGCSSSAYLYFANHRVSGKQKDLSGFGHDFESEVHLKITVVRGKADIFIDGERVYTIEEKIRPAAIKGIDFRFRGLGAVSEVRLGRPEGPWLLNEDFVDHGGADGF